MIPRTVALCTALAFASPLQAQVKVHVVDTPVQLAEGHETAASISAALNRVAEARAAGDASPATIYLADKTYRVTAPIMFDAALVGEGLTLEAAPSCSPVISGGRLIENFKAAPDGTWRTTIEEVHSGDWWFEELFVGDRRATRARHPNASHARVVEAGSDNRTSFTFNPDELPLSLIDTRSEVVLLHDWSTSRVRIQAMEPVTQTITLANSIGCKAPHYAITNFESHPRFFIEGSPLLADAPGEWALDRKSGQLIYVPLPGEAIDTLEFVAPFAPALLRATGTEDVPLKNLTLRGIRFSHMAWPIPSYGYAEGQAAFYEKRDVEGSDGTRDAIPAALEFTWAANCTIDACVIEAIGASGLWLGTGCRGCLVSGTIVRDIGGNGVMIGEAGGRTMHGEPWWKVATDQAASSNTIRRSLVEECGRRFFGAVGIWIGLARKTTVEQCEIRKLPYTGVSVGWHWDETPTPCRENKIVANHIHAVMQTLSDGGGIYTLGSQPGTVLRHNAIHDIRLNAGVAPSNGIFFDQGTSEILTDSNVFWDIEATPIRWHWTFKNRVTGNRFALSADQEIAYYNRAVAEDIDYEDNSTVSESSMPDGFAAGIIAAAGPAGTPQLRGSADPSILPVDRVTLERWRDARFGMFIHWGPVSLKGTEIGWSRGGPIPRAEYDALPQSFDPVAFDAAEWVRIAQDAGMKYMVLTARHHDGFCLWDSALSDHDMQSTPFKRNIVSELAEACNEAGMDFGFYYSILDWHHPDYNSTGTHGGAGFELAPGQLPSMDRFQDYVEGQLRELVELCETPLTIWFDGEWEDPWTKERGRRLFEFCRRIAPGALINNRVGKARHGMSGTTSEDAFTPGDYDTPEQRVGSFEDERPWETCMTICQQWSWKPGDRMKSLQQCIRTLVSTAGGDGNLLFNVGPMPDGRIEPRQVDRLREMGAWLERKGESIHGTRGGPFYPGEWGVSTHRGKTVYLHLFDLEGDVLQLPMIGREIQSARVLGVEGTEGRVRFEQDEHSLRLWVPNAAREAIDTVVMLQLGGPAKGMVKDRTLPTDFDAGLYGD